MWKAIWHCMEHEPERKHHGQLRGFLCKPLVYLEVLGGSFISKTQPLFPENAEAVDQRCTKNRKERKKCRLNWLNLVAIFLLSCPAELMDKGRVCRKHLAADVHRLHTVEQGKQAAMSNLTRCWRERLSRTNSLLPATDVGKLKIRSMLFLRRLLFMQNKSYFFLQE